MIYEITIIIQSSPRVNMDVSPQPDVYMLPRSRYSPRTYMMIFIHIWRKWWRETWAECACMNLI